MPKTIQHIENLSASLNLNRRFVIASEKCKFIKLNLYVFFYKSNFTNIKVGAKSLLFNSLIDSYIVIVDFYKYIIYQNIFYYELFILIFYKNQAIWILEYILFQIISFLMKK